MPIHTVAPGRELLCFRELLVPEGVQEKLEGNFSQKHLFFLLFSPCFLGHHFHVSMILAKKNLSLLTFSSIKINILNVPFGSLVRLLWDPAPGEVDSGELNFGKSCRVSDGCWWGVFSLCIIRERDSIWEIHQYPDPFLTHDPSVSWASWETYTPKAGVGLAASWDERK